MSVNATANVNVPTAVSQAFVVQAHAYAGHGLVPVAAGGGTYILAHSLRNNGTPNGTEPIRAAVPGGPANYVIGLGATPITDAINKGALVFANLSDATTAST